MPDRDDIVDELVDAPPSVKLVYYVLQREQPLSQQGIATETMLTKRTIRIALGRLDDMELLSQGNYPGDARKNLYALTRQEQTEHNDTAVSAN